MNHKSQIKIVVTLVFFVLFFVATPVFAAEVLFDGQSNEFRQGEEFLLPVFLNTEKELINAIEGRVVFPDKLLEVIEIMDDSSVINFWIEKPHISQSGVIVFAGITPGGFSGRKEILFLIVFRVKKNGTGAIQMDEMQILKNDGEGTPANVKISSFQSQKSL